MSFDSIAWPGPRPLDEHTGIVLAGRESELTEIYEQCRSCDIIQITAPSGVGKTSFIEAGLRPMLAAAGKYVPPRMLWPDATHGIELGNVPAATAAERVYRKLIGADPLDDDLEPYDAILQVAEGRPTVVVLDQYEELIRYQKTLGAELLRVVALNAKETRTTHIVISRSEWVEDLRPLRSAGATWWPLRLIEVTDPSALRSIIDVPAEDRGIKLQTAASARLIKCWFDAREQAERFRASRLGADDIPVVGLLHFHALLREFARWADAVLDPDCTTVTEHDVENFLLADGKQRDPPAQHDTEADGFALSFTDNALTAYVKEEIDGALRRQLEGELPGGLRWRNGPALLLARVAPALRSAGFKLPQSLLSLVPLALSDELTPGPAQGVARRFEAVAELTSSESRQKVLDAAFGSSATMGAGIAATWSDAEVIGEMVRCLHFALDRVSDTNVNVLRRFVGAGQPVYELVHDGMGPALSRWAQDFVDSDVAQVGTIAGQPGSLLLASIVGTTLGAMPAGERDFWGVSGVDDDNRVVLDRVGRPQSLIRSSSISDVVLRRGDFTGAKFSGTHFRNVVFEDCRMVSTLFEDCVLEGVRFVASEVRDTGLLNLLTIRFIAGGPEASRRACAADVQFENLPTTTGVFLEGVDGGRWMFANSTIRSLVITGGAPSGAPATLATVNTTVHPLTVYGEGVVRREPPDDPAVTVTPT